MLKRWRWWHRHGIVGGAVVVVVGGAVVVIVVIVVIESCSNHHHHDRLRFSFWHIIITLIRIVLLLIFRICFLLYVYHVFGVNKSSLV